MEDNSVTNILLMNKENCALKLVNDIILFLLHTEKCKMSNTAKRVLKMVVFTCICFIIGSNSVVLC